MPSGSQADPDPTERLRRTVGRFFGPSGPAEVQALLAEFRPVELPGGAWLFRQGDPADALFLVARGRLQVWGEAEPDAAPRLLAELGGGESIGEVGLLTGGTRTAGVRAIRDSVLLRLDRDAFLRLAAGHPALVLSVTTQVAERLRDRTAAGSTVARGLENLAVMPLGRAPAVDLLAARLAAALEVHDSALHLDARWGGTRGESALAEGLYEEEARHRFVVLEAEPRRSAWSEFCRRHADVLIFVGDAAQTPSAGPWASREREEPAGVRRILVLVHPGDEISGTARWLAALPADQVHHVRAGSAARDLARLARVLAGEALGLVLGGGAARGFAHVGVFRALEEAGLCVDWVGGSSIGAVFAATVAHDWTPERIGVLARRAFVEEKPLGDFTLPLVSLLRGRRLRRLVLQHFGGDIEDLPIPYFCVSSHLDRGELLVHERGPLWRAIRASVALPGVLPPAVVDGSLAIDGGILNNLPVDVMRERPVGRVIGVDLSSPRERRVDYDEVPGPFQILRSRLLPFGRRPRAPNILSLMMKSSLVASAAHSRAMHRRADLVLTPPVGSFGLLDVRAFDRIVAVGYEHARERLAAWKPPARAPSAARAGAPA
jgi:predicted acylesterase/phospholipase RssA/CRP-like cAMP-binding protein